MKKTFIVSFMVLISGLSSTCKKRSDGVVYAQGAALTQELQPNGIKVFEATELRCSSDEGKVTLSISDGTRFMPGDALSCAKNLAMLIIFNRLIYYPGYVIFPKSKSIDYRFYVCRLNDSGPGAIMEVYHKSSKKIDSRVDFDNIDLCFGKALDANMKLLNSEFAFVENNN